MKLFILIISGFISLVSLHKNAEAKYNHTYKDLVNNLLTDVFLNETDNNQSIELDELLSNIDDFIDMPENGTSWQVFGETGMDEYTFKDDEGYDWLGVRPKFKDKIKKLNGKEVLIQGYMFPLEQGEKQSRFLLGPFPLTCPYHPHVSSNLSIEVHAENPILYTYDAVNITGRLELVEEDNLYNVFYRLKNSKIIP